MTYISTSAKQVELGKIWRVNGTNDYARRLVVMSEHGESFTLTLYSTSAKALAFDEPKQALEVT
jgi:hypothetical protein